MSWGKKYAWDFSPLGNGTKIGVNDAGIGIFKKHPYTGLAKEILQNVIDAKDEDIDRPAQACFEIIYVNKEDIPGAERLSQVIKLCHDYYNEGDDGIKTGMLKSSAEQFLDCAEKVPVLKISDYNTRGLTGSKEEKGTNWTGLVRESGATNKSGGASGSFGVGKYAPFNFSSIRTIIYSTKDKYGEIALQGKTILTTFRDSNDSKLKQNIGLFGLSGNEDCKAIYDFADIPEVYRRDRQGTDLFVLGCKKEPDWMQQIAISVLNYFFYTIYIGDLEVLIKENDKEIIINKDKLADLMNEYKEYCSEKNIDFAAPVFWEVLTSERTKTFTENLMGKGEVKLYLIIDPEYADRRILEMRKAGMVIREDNAFRIGAYFHGIFIATGKGSKSEKPEDNINSFLRKCENQAHDTWSKDEYEDNKEEADRVIRKIHGWILENIKSMMPKIEADNTDAYGLSDLLPNQCDEGDKEQRESAYYVFEPIPIELTSIMVKGDEKNIGDISVSAKEKKEDSEIVIFDETGDEAVEGGSQKQRTNKSVGPEPHPNSGPNPGPYFDIDPKPNDGGENEVMRRKSKWENGNSGRARLQATPISRVKTPYDNTKKAFRVSFIAGKDVNEGYIDLKIGSDDGYKRNAEVKKAYLSGEELILWKNYIRIPKWQKGEKIVINVELKGTERCQLEVKAYAK